MQIKKQFQIQAPADQVWETIARRFSSVSEWASVIDQSSAVRDGMHPRNAPCSGRVCQTEMGPFRETITAFDEDQYELAYDAMGEKMPFFVRGMSNRWVLTPIGKSETHVSMHMQAKLMVPFNMAMGPLMKLQMGKMLKGVIEELKFYIENGKPHPRKLLAHQRGGQMAA